MYTEIIHNINKKFIDLQSVLSTIIPLQKISKNPTDIFRSEFDNILKCIDDITNKFTGVRNNLIDECVKLEKSIYLKCEVLKIDMPRMPNICNLYFKKEYLMIELSKINLLEKYRLREINYWVNKSKKLHYELYNDDFLLEIIEPSIMYLENLKKLYKSLKQDKEKKDIQKKELVKDLQSFYKKLEINEKVSIYDRFVILEEKYKTHKNMCINRQKELNVIKQEIHDKENLLNFSLTRFLDLLSDKYIGELKERCYYLQNEYEKKVEEIYSEHFSTLKNLLSLFGMKLEIYEKNDKGLLQIKNRIKDLESKKDLFLEINNLINNRYALLERMNEFEKIASDPKRLFKSSFQLNREEKFRKNAFPSLLKLETELIDKLKEYTEKYGIFYKNEENYENVLKAEIEGRIINKMVFINKYDSPYKKKKM